MELLSALLIVGFFIALNKVRIGLLGSENNTSEFFMILSTLVFGFIYSLMVWYISWFIWILCNIWYNRKIFNRVKEYLWQ